MGGNDFDGSGGVIYYTPGDGFSGTLLVDGNNFPINPSDIHQWLIDHNMLGRQVVPQAPSGGLAPVPAAGNGLYQWEVYSTADPNLSDSDRENLQEQSAAQWQRMLGAWKLFQQQIQLLATLTDGDAIIGKIGDAIAALGMIELHDWGQPYIAEFAAWIGLSAASSTPANLQAAGQTVTQAGNTLLGQWRARMDQGNYESYDLTDAQHAFITACGTARSQL